MQFDDSVDGFDDENDEGGQQNIQLENFDVAESLGSIKAPSPSDGTTTQGETILSQNDLSSTTTNLPAGRPTFYDGKPAMEIEIDGRKAVFPVDQLDSVREGLSRPTSPQQEEKPAATRLSASSTTVPELRKDTASHPLDGKVKQKPVTPETAARLSEEDDINAVFDIRDYTAVSPFEKLSRELELIMKKW